MRTNTSALWRVLLGSHTITTAERSKIHSMLVDVHHFSRGFLTFRARTYLVCATQFHAFILLITKKNVNIWRNYWIRLGDRTEFGWLCWCLCLVYVSVSICYVPVSSTVSSCPALFSLHVVPEDPKFEHDKRRKYANNVHAVTTGYAGPKLIVSTLQKSCYALQNEKGYVELREWRLLECNCPEPCT